MPAPYTVRVAAASVPPNTTVTLWTAPETDTWVLRDLIVANTATVASTVSLGIRPGSGPAYWLYVRSALSGQTTEHLDLRQVVLPGEKLELTAGAASLSVLLTGYRLREE